MNITEINTKDIHIFSIGIENDIIYIEYSGGYQENYYNVLKIDLMNKTYVSNIKDINKNELAKILNKLYLTLKFDTDSYKKYSIMELWLAIKHGVEHIYEKDLLSIDNALFVNINNYINIIGNNQIQNLAQEYNNADNVILNKLIDHYYLLYLQYAYKLFYPETLSIENTTEYNKVFDDFYKMLADNENYDPDDFIIHNPDKDLIMQYLLFAQSFVFQFTNDLKRVFSE